MSERLSKETLDRLEELEREATAGDWEAAPNDGIKAWLEPPEDVPEYHRIGGMAYGRDSRFVAELRNNALALIAQARRVEELEEENEELRDQIIDYEEELIERDRDG